MIITIEVLHFLREWLENHLLGSDKKYGPFLNSKGVYGNVEESDKVSELSSDVDNYNLDSNLPGCRLVENCNSQDEHEHSVCHSRVGGNP